MVSSVAGWMYIFVMVTLYLLRRIGWSLVNSIFGTCLGLASWTPYLNSNKVSTYFVCTRVLGRFRKHTMHALRRCTETSFHRFRSRITKMQPRHPAINFESTPAATLKCSCPASHLKFILNAKFLPGRIVNLYRNLGVIVCNCWNAWGL